MTAVAGIDPSLGGTGYAGPDGRVWQIRTNSNLTPYERISRVLARVERLIGDDLPELLVFEAYGAGGPGRLSMIRGIELGGALRLSCHARLLPWADFAPATVKAYATGNGHAEKPLMADAFETRVRRSAAGISHDEIDALWLRDLGLWLVGQEEAAGPHPSCRAEIVEGIIERGRKALDASAVRTRETR